MRLLPPRIFANAPRPLPISTYDGSGQCVHPDVLALTQPFAGYRYWLAMTPYPGGNDALENPSIRVSHDGRSWHPLAGAPDPIVPPPADPDYHHADPDLVVDGDTLFLYYLTRSRTRPHAIISVISSGDGRVWSAPRALLDQRWGVSPAVVRHASSWSMYYVHADLHRGPSSYRLRRRSGSSCVEFSAETECELSIDGHHLWHIDLITSELGLEGVVAAFPHGADQSRCRLFHVRSADGYRFEVTAPTPLLRPSLIGWDNRMIYRSTLWREETGEYVLLYSAASWGLRCGLGVLRGPLSGLRPEATRATDTGKLAVSLDEARGLAKYLVVRWLPRSILERIRPGLLGAAGGAS